MSNQEQGGKFEVQEDSQFQQLEWRTERIGWIVWVLILVAGAAGLLGPGPLSSVSVETQDRQLAVEYNRISRRRADSDIVVRVAPQLIRNGEIRLHASSAFFENEAVERIDPQPREVVHAGGTVLHVFAAQPSAEPAVITFRTKAVRVGRHDYVLRVDGGPELRFWKFVLP
jgi:hypothetical protein